MITVALVKMVTDNFKFGINVALRFFLLKITQKILLFLHNLDVSNLRKNKRKLTERKKNR